MNFEEKIVGMLTDTLEVSDCDLLLTFDQVLVVRRPPVRPHISAKRLQDYCPRISDWSGLVYAFTLPAAAESVHAVYRTPQVLGSQ